MTYRVLFTARPRADAFGQFQYLSDRSPAAAAKWFAGLEKAVATLGNGSERHPIAEEETTQLGISLRQMLYGCRPGVFRILFSVSVEGDTVILHHVRHGVQGPVE